jgi:hypothetical protein
VVAVIVITKDYSTHIQNRTTAVRNIMMDKILMAQSDFKRGFWQAIVRKKAIEAINPATLGRPGLLSRVVGAFI